MTYANLHEESSTVCATGTIPRTYIDDLIEHVRDTPREKDARNNAEVIVKEQIAKNGRQVGEKFGNYIAILVFIILLENFIIFYL